MLTHGSCGWRAPLSSHPAGHDYKLPGGSLCALHMGLFGPEVTAVRLFRVPPSLHRTQHGESDATSRASGRPIPSPR